MEIRATARALYQAHPDWSHEDIADELGNLFPEERRTPVERTVGYWVSGKKGRSPQATGTGDHWEWSWTVTGDQDLFGAV